MERKIIILYYNEEDDVELVENYIKEQCPSCVVKSISKREEYTEAIKTDVYDLIISQGDQQHILDVISDYKLAKAITPHTKFILLSSEIAEEHVKDIKSYKEIEKVPRKNLNMLIPTVNRALNEVYLKHDISLHCG
ncbi:hypothetical protein ABRY23_10855 [Melioribacteraceae bacterium 4301-Me]|uniref:hypothetical protein n=1 Tax=Pyranulibacter aquaticus TaxID=3163344 RepID=UPI0035983A89